MSRIERSAERVNLFISLAKHAWDAAGALGIQGYLTGAAWIAAVGVWAVLIYALENLPFWSLALLALLLATLSTRLIVELRKAWAVRGLKSLDLQQLGADCLAYREDLFEFLVGRADTAPSRHVHGLGAGNDTDALHQAWAQGVDYSQKTRARLAQKFAHRAVALNHQLDSAGIRPASLWSFDHNAAGIAAYYGAVGELLKRGLLKEAREMSPDDLQHAHFYIG
jgi:hypothetical protein